MTATAIKSRMAGAVTRAGTVRASAALTSSYVAGTVIDAEDFGTLVLLVKYTMGSAETGNTAVLKVEWSADGTNFYQQTNHEATVGLREYSFTAVSVAGTYDWLAIAVPIAALSNVRVSAKESGVASNYGTCEIKYAIGW